jgi:hypothetical protein
MFRARSKRSALIMDHISRMSVHSSIAIQYEERSLKV